MEAIASRLEAIATRSKKLLGWRVEAIATSNKDAIRWMIDPLDLLQFAEESKVSDWSSRKYH